MPALSGQAMIVRPHTDGTPLVCATWFWNPDGMIGSRPLRNNPLAWVDPWGTTWPANTAAFMSINKTNRPWRLKVSNTLGLILRTVPVPVGSSSIPVATLILGGLFLDVNDFNPSSLEVAP